MKDTRIYGLAIAALICTIALSSSVANVNAPPPPPPFLRGPKLNILDLWIRGITSVTLPANEPFHVIHGWLWPNWTLSDPIDRSNFLNDIITGFELSIDGTPATIRKWLQYDATLDAMYKYHYKQFSGTEFTPGASHIFKGRWYSPYGDAEYTFTVNFT